MRINQGPQNLFKRWSWRTKVPTSQPILFMCIAASGPLTIPKKTRQSDALTLFWGKIESLGSVRNRNVML